MEYTLVTRGRTVLIHTEAVCRGTPENNRIRGTPRHRFRP